MSRLRTRNRCRAGTDPGGYSETTRPAVGDRLEQRLVLRGIAAVDPAGQHGDRSGRPPASAPRWAAPSIPNAAPETTVKPLSPARRRARPLCAGRSRWRPGPRRSPPPGCRVRPAPPTREPTTRWATPGLPRRPSIALPGLGATTAHRSPDRHLHRRASRHPHHRPRRSSPHPTRCGRQRRSASRRPSSGCLVAAARRRRCPVRRRTQCGHAGCSGVRSRPPQARGQARGPHRRGRRRVGPRSPARTLSGTAPARTRAAASNGPTAATSRAKAGAGGSATRDR